MNNLVGQKVRLSPQDKKAGGNKTRTLAILSEYYEKGKRMYEVRDEDTQEVFPAHADIYDGYFLRQRQKILPEFTKGQIYNTGNLNYSISQKV